MTNFDPTSSGTGTHTISYRSYDVVQNTSNYNVSTFGTPTAVSS